MISDQNARHKILTDLSSSFAVDAGAGTGKTTLLIGRLLALVLDQGVKLPKIAAITFTDKAAGELVERLRNRLEDEFTSKKLLAMAPAERKEREQRLRDALKDLEQAQVSTIHSFCSSILREYPVEVGVDPQFAVLDQVQADALEAEAWESWLKKRLAERQEALMPFFCLGGTFKHLEELKDHLLANRSLLLPPQTAVFPDPAPALADLKRIWADLEPLLRGVDPEDSLAKLLLPFKKEWQRVLDSPESERAFLLAGLEAVSSNRKGNQDKWGKEKLEKARALTQQFAERLESYAAPVKDAAVTQAAAWLWDYLGQYAEAKTRQGFLDFDDLLSKTRDLLKTRFEVREELKKRYSHLFVDEFQDTDPLQVEIVFFLSELPMPRADKALGTTKARRSPGGLAAGEPAKVWQEVELQPGKLFLVGDPQQSIYRFRRADVEIYGEAKARLSACGGQVEKLTENFRTLSPIIDWVNQGFEAIFDPQLFPYNAQHASRPFEGKKGQLPPLLALTMAEPQGKPSIDDLRRQEAETVADLIQKLLQDKPVIVDPRSPQGEIRYKTLEAGDITILFRALSNTEEVYETALRQRGIQFQVVGGKKFYNRPEVVALETLLTCLESPADEPSLVALLRSSLFGFTDEELFLYRESGGIFHFLRAVPGKIGEAFKLLRTWYFGTRALTPAETLLYLYERTNLLALAACQPHGEQRVANLMKVVDQCRDLEASQNFTYRAFVKWLSRQREEDAMEGEAPKPEDTGDQVTLMTLHKSKGLEFPVVILSASLRKNETKPTFIVNRHQGRAQFRVGAEDLKLQTASFDPVAGVEETQDSQEDLRLLYVGATRARECLVLSVFAEQKSAAFLKPLVDRIEDKAFEKISIVPSEGTKTASALAVDLPEKDRKDPKVEEQKAWLQQQIAAKKALVEKRKGQSRTVSVTQLAHSDDDKTYREGYRLEGQELDDANPGEKSGKAFGMLTHQLLEKGWDWDEKTLQKAACHWAVGLGLSTDKADEAADLVVKALASDLLQRAKKSGKVFRELSLTGKGDADKTINAVIDLAFLEDDQWVLVDYKTDRDPSPGLEAYRQQLDHYGKLLKAFSGKEIKEKKLYFLRSNKTEKV